METVYKVTHNGDFCILHSLDCALELMKSQIRDNEDDEDIEMSFELDVVEMTEDEISNLPEFDGF